MTAMTSFVNYLTPARPMYVEKVPARLGSNNS
jgi:hypothetical protein